MHTKYRVTWLDRSTGEYDSIDVHSMRQAQETATTLLDKATTKEVEVSTFTPSVFHEFSIKFVR